MTIGSSTESEIVQSGGTYGHDNQLGWWFTCNVVVSDVTTNWINSDTPLACDYFPLPAYLSNVSLSNEVDSSETTGSWFTLVPTGDTLVTVDCTNLEDGLSQEAETECTSYQYDLTNDVKVVLPDLGEMLQDFVLTDSETHVSGCTYVTTGSTVTGVIPIFSYGVGKKNALIGVRRNTELKFFRATRDDIDSDWGQWEDISEQVMTILPYIMDRNKYTGFFVVS